MAHFLINRHDNESSASKVKVLTSVTRITIGQDSKMTVNNVASVSRTKAMSFRSVKRKDSILQHRTDEKTSGMGCKVAVELEETMTRLGAEGDRQVPFHTRKMTRCVMNGTAPGPADQSPKTTSSMKSSKHSNNGLGFTEIFEELTTLSKNITRTLEGGDVDDDDDISDKTRRQDVSLPSVTACPTYSGGKVRSPNVTMADKIRSTRSLDAKLAAIRKNLEGTECRQ